MDKGGKNEQLDNVGCCQRWIACWQSMHGMSCALCGTEGLSKSVSACHRGIAAAVNLLGGALP